MSTRSGLTPPPSPTQVAECLDQLEKCAKVARKNHFKLATHEFYGDKARDSLASLKKYLLLLKGSANHSRDEALTTELIAVETILDRLALDLDASSLLALIGEAKLRVNSHLAAVLESREDRDFHPATPYLPTEIVPNGVYRRIVEEVNVCFESRCYNACAAMLRRLAESLIIEAFEAHGIDEKIKVDGEFQDLKALIGKAIAEPKLALGRNTRTGLPHLKLFGDLSLHSRTNLIRQGDLERLRNYSRVAIEELAHHCKRG